MPDEISNTEMNQLMMQIGEILEGKPRDVQACLLAGQLALWIKCHRPAKPDGDLQLMRSQLLDDFLGTYQELLEQMDRNPILSQPVGHG